MAFFDTDPPKPLRDVLKNFLDDVPYRKRLKRGMILSLWPETVGPSINEQTKNVHFEHGNLVIHVKSPAWRNEIHMKRYSIAKKLNDEVGEKIIKEIVVRS
jgi:predicted nucleic acid-binding Zn ribbon protein